MTCRALKLIVLLFAIALAPGCAKSEPVHALEDWELVTPSRREAVRLPAHLEDLAAGEYSLVTRVVLPDELRGEPISLAIPLFHGRTELWVNGVRMAPTEPADETSYRAVGPQRWKIPAALGTEGALRLELRVDHRWTQSAWHDSVPRLSVDRAGDAGYRTRRALYLLGAWGALATLLTVGFTYFAVFLFDRRRTAHGWFALATLAATVYPLFNLGLTQVFGTFDVALLGIALAVAPIATIRFTHVQFELGRTPRSIVALPLLVIVPALFWHGPFEAARYLTPLALGVVAVAIGYELFGLTRLIRRAKGTINARIILSCWVLLGVSIVNDAVAWLGLGDPLGGVRTGGIGLMAFALLQSMALSREHILAFRRAESLNVELSARVAQLERRQREIVRLNEELRRQIAERSRDLAGVLTGFGHGPAVAPLLSSGYVVAERYRVGCELGAGGMGKVYEVRRLADGQRFAMKIMTGRIDAARAVRFAREAELISELDHPNVVRVVDIGVATEGFLYLVMEHVPGCSLRECSDRFGDSSWALAVLHQLADALAAIHRHDIVHRDVKPGNVLVSGSDEAPLVKLTDFGIATITDGESQDGIVTQRTGPRADAAPAPCATAPKTETGVLLGTPLYMAPELWCGVRNATTAADVFAFGVIAYELLCGARPFVEPPVIALQRGAYDPPTRFECGVPQAVASALARCFATSPSERPRAEELATVLRDACDEPAHQGRRHEAQISHNSLR